MDNPHGGYDPLGLMPKYPEEDAKPKTKAELRAEKKAAKAKEDAKKTTDEVVERAQNGKFKRAGNYHADTGHNFSDERVLDILKNPDAVYHSTANSGNLIFRQGDDIVVTTGGGPGAGNAITAYGPSGVLGESGARATGGLPTDAGSPITHTDVVEGKIPGKQGNMAPGERIR